MNVSGLLGLIRALPQYERLLEELQGPKRQLSPLSYPILDAAKPYLLAALQEDLERPLLLLAGRPERANELFAQLRLWSRHPERVVLFPEPDPLPYERVPWDPATIQRRLSILHSLGQKEGEEPPLLVVASARAALQMTLPPTELEAHSQTLRQGQALSPNELLASCYQMGYEPTTTVDRPGAFSRRGGILDIFSPQMLLALRIELFGDEIESLRLFDTTTQRSQQTVSQAEIIPASEALLMAGLELPKLELGGCHPAARAEFEEDLAALERKERFRGRELYMPHLYPEPAMLLAHLPPQGLAVIEDAAELELTVGELESQSLKLRREMLSRGELAEGFASSYFTWDDLRERLEERGSLALSQPTEEGAFLQAKLYGGQLRQVIADCQARRKEAFRVVLVSRQAPRLAELFEEQWVYVSPSEEVLKPPLTGSLTLVKGIIAQGWQMMGPEPLLLLSDAEIFGWAMPQPRPEPRPAREALPMALPDLNPGDYAVHIDHGVALFRGLVKEPGDGGEREYLLLEYAAGDKLYVPTYQADRVSRYVSPGDQPPRITRLGSADWEQVKARAKRAVEDIARELLELYAAREVIPGHAFSPDTPWQAELEAAFPYAETPDQLRAIQEVKADMEKPKPMDRLVCGDVGYGKTEVAVRAAFKAVMDGRQVAVLVPTTVLAQQHLGTFRERLAPFPAEAEMLSRFRSRREQQEILKRLQAGSVDIIIGTHRLLQRDVFFKDLGLLVIDEEQRFGVTHKEHLKQMRRQVDVLTVTATPIPRTLYLSLSGARDMSIIDTPPENRLPIITRVAEYDETLIRQAILRELERGGQVYFVYNRVQGIRQMAVRVQRLVPEASIAIAHGQMREEELERVMLRFAAGEFDILVCTSIIESGLDIPNVNTIIINPADHFGLAQLHQLRGRVGRSSRRAYAYFLYPKYHSITLEARRRLQAIAEATQLGAGFSIAMRDLEIRGAGELLGARQHGHITAIGFDLYCRLLAQAIGELKGEERGIRAGGLPPLRESVQLNLPLDAYLPAPYIPDEDLRLELYRRLAEVGGVAEVQEMAREIEDRFGAPPPPVRNLLYVVGLKARALLAAVRAITTEEGQFILKPKDLSLWQQAWRQRRLPPFVRVGRTQVWIPLVQGRWQEMLEQVLDAMRQYLAQEKRSPSPVPLERP